MATPQRRRSTQRFSLLTVLLMVGIGASLAILISEAMFVYLDMPEVHKSWTTKECVRVVDHASVTTGRAPYTCTTLPKRYETVWVR